MSLEVFSLFLGSSYNFCIVSGESTEELRTGVKEELNFIFIVGFVFLITISTDVMRNKIQVFGSFAWI